MKTEPYTARKKIRYVKADFCRLVSTPMFRQHRKIPAKIGEFPAGGAGPDLRQREETAMPQSLMRCRGRHE